MKVMFEECVAVILCGGKSSRMGFDKALLEWEGELLITSVAAQLKEVFKSVILVTDDKGKFNNSEHINDDLIINDHYQEKGPLGGICTAFEVSEAPYLFVIACDMPNPNLDIIATMYQMRKGNQVILCEIGGYLEPLFAFYHRSCLAVFQNQIDLNQLQIRRKFNQLRVNILQIEGAKDNLFINLNTQQDVGNWQDQIRQVKKQRIQDQ